MPLVIAGIVVAALAALTVRANRRTRRRVLDGSAEGSMPPGSGADPARAANEARATIDAMNGRGAL